jgi:membrane protein
LELNWLQSILFGLVSGAADIIPVSGQAHRLLLLKFFGVNQMPNLLALVLHLSVAAALYLSSQGQFVRMNRARALARIPKKKRKRPLDTRSMMDWSLIKTMLVPTVIGLLLNSRVRGWSVNMFLIAGMLFVNGLILYIPQFLPTSNRDSRTLTRLEGVLMGLGAGASVLPGISTVGIMVSIASVCGIERLYGLNMTFIVKLFFLIGLMVYDVLAIITDGLGGLTVMLLAQYLFTGLLSFGASMFAIRLLRRLAPEHGFHTFGVYCWGLALFTFILNLVV